MMLVLVCPCGHWVLWSAWWHSNWILIRRTWALLLLLAANTTVVYKHLLWGGGEGGGLCSLTGKSFIGHARQHEHSDTRAPPPSSRARLKAPALGPRAYTRRASELHRSSLGQTEIFYYTDSFRKFPDILKPDWWHHEVPETEDSR